MRLHWRLDPAQRRHGGTGCREHLAFDASPDQRDQLVVLPNSFLAKLGLTNISRPDETHLVSLIVRVAPTRMPSIILDVMRSVLLSCNSIVKEPPPIIALKGLDATALEIELLFRVSSPAQRTPARNEVLDLVYRHCKSAGLLLAMPPASAVAMLDLPTEETAEPARVTPLELIEAIPIFTSLTGNKSERSPKRLRCVSSAKAK